MDEDDLGRDSIGAMVDKAGGEDGRSGEGDAIRGAGGGELVGRSERLCALTGVLGLLPSFPRRDLVFGCGFSRSEGSEGSVVDEERAGFCVWLMESGGGGRIGELERMGEEVFALLGLGSAMKSVTWSLLFVTLAFFFCVSNSSLSLSVSSSSLDACICALAAWLALDVALGSLLNHCSCW